MEQIFNVVQAPDEMVGSFGCPGCPLNFKFKGEMDKHIKKTFKEEIFCRFCAHQPSFHIRDEFFDHIENEHGSNGVSWAIVLFSSHFFLLNFAALL